MERKAAVAKLAEMIKDIKVAMLTTVDDDGSLRSRPMQTQNKAFDGQIWFFTYKDSAKSHNVEKDARVNVAYSEPDDDRYVSISGRASVVVDRAKAEELWSPVHKAWFPQGLEDPQLALIRVDVDHAEYWDTPSSSMVQLFGMAKALATGEPYRPGENQKVNL